ncbi:MAG: pseudouridine synthase [Candidatus Saccharimonadales bacterium]
MRLNAYLARAGVSSRRGADKLIQAERVKVNGKPGQLNDEVSENDLIELDGRKIQSQRLRYILLNKPDRTITTLSDPQDRPKVTDLIDIPERVVPVGRLDFDTTGVLLLTNDGELAHKLMHPSFEVDKTYEAKVQGTITSKILNTLSNGVELEDGKTAPAKTRKLSENKIELTIHEGRNHQVKRMLEAVGLDTRRLHRSRYGKLGVESLKPGQWRDLTLAEINGLKN